LTQHRVPPATTGIDTPVARAEAACATLAKRPGEVFEGGSRGRRADPGGHAGAVAQNPSRSLDAEERMHLPEPS
jgi:hypothetical protein